MAYYKGGVAFKEQFESLVVGYATHSIFNLDETVHDINRKEANIDKYVDEIFVSDDIIEKQLQMIRDILTVCQTINY